MATPNANLASAQASWVLARFAGGAATITCYSAADVALAQATLPDPAGTVSGNVITWDLDPDLVDESTVAGVIDYAEIADGSDALRLTVGTSGADLIVNTTTVQADGSLEFISLTSTFPQVAA